MFKVLYWGFSFLLLSNSSTHISYLVIVQLPHLLGYPWIHLLEGGVYHLLVLRFKTRFEEEVWILVIDEFTSQTLLDDELFVLSILHGLLQILSINQFLSGGCDQVVFLSPTASDHLGPKHRNHKFATPLIENRMCAGAQRVRSLVNGSRFHDLAASLG